MEGETPKTTLVYVRWFDASYQRGECELEDLVERVELESAGVLIRETEETISFALDYYPKDGTWRHIEHVPKVNVREAQWFEVR